MMSAGLCDSSSTILCALSRLTRSETALAMSVGPTRAAIIFDVCMPSSRFLFPPYARLALWATATTEYRKAIPFQIMLYEILGVDLTARDVIAGSVALERTRIGKAARLLRLALAMTAHREWIPRRRLGTICLSSAL